MPTLLPPAERLKLPQVDLTTQYGFYVLCSIADIEWRKELFFTETFMEVIYENLLSNATLTDSGTKLKLRMNPGALTEDWQKAEIPTAKIIPHLVPEKICGINTANVLASRLKDCKEYFKGLLIIPPPVAFDVIVVVEAEIVIGGKIRYPKAQVFYK